MVTLATFDVLDMHLKQEAKTFSALPDDYRWNNSIVAFHLDPAYWNKYYPPIEKYFTQLNWSEYKYAQFTDLGKTIPGDGIGIYLFIVRPEKQVRFLPQFVMYVGIAGEGNSGRPLKERLNDYFNLGHIRKRTKLHGMLKKYYHYTWVMFSEIKNITSAALEQLEEDFHGFLIPPFADRDFPVEMKVIIKAQFTR